LGTRWPPAGEWEAAARGGDARLYPWGDTAPTCAEAYFSECSLQPGPEQLVIARFPAGRAPNGCFDLAGNLAEWVADWAAPRSALNDAQAVGGGPPTGTQKIIKGGSYIEPASNLRVAHRGGLAQDGTDITTGSPPAQNLPYIGFRCALSR
jgi:iron(II)-dependent oxidoreductase